MSSTNKTTHLRLNQWVGSDPVLRSDFNFDNSKIDAAVYQRALVRLEGETLTAAASAVEADLSLQDLTRYMELQVHLSPKLGATGTVTLQADSQTAVTLGNLPVGNRAGLIVHLMVLPGGLGGWWMAPGGTGTVTGAFQLPVAAADLSALTLALSGGGSFQAGTAWAVYGVVK